MTENDNKQYEVNFKPGAGRNFGGGGRLEKPVQKAKNVKGTLRRLIPYFKAEWKLLFFVVVFIIIDSIVNLTIPYLTGLAVDSMGVTINIVNFKTLKIIVIVMLIAYLISAFTKFIQEWLMAGISQRVVRTLRKNLFKKLQNIPISFFDTHTHGEVMSRLSNDIELLSSTISQAAIQLFSSSITVTGSLIMMFVLSPLLVVASLITMPLVFILSKGIAKRTRKIFKQQQIILGSLNGQIEETISGLNVIKAFNREENIIEDFEKLNQELCSVGIMAQIWSGLLMPIMNVINNLGFTIIAVVGGAMAVNNFITVGIVASFLSYSRQFGRPLNEIANMFNTLQSALAGAERVFEIFDEADETKDVKDAVIFSNVKGEVIFENVSFGYKQSEPVLKDISFKVPSGTSVALVGPTGSGKTTIVNLLVRFYDVTEGRILIDGCDIKQYKRDSLRKQFGMVLQDTYLFSDTIIENIKYGRPNATISQIKTAAKMANADIFIERLDKGYDTVLVEGGNNLSQGQRQLLAIARAILSEPSILILDEATSNVDTRTELNIQQAMLKLMDNRTSFIIAHRLSTIREADCIIVIKDGKIIEKGTHKELIEFKGFYYNCNKEGDADTKK